MGGFGWNELYPFTDTSEACPVCGTPGGRFVTHVCMTAGVPSHDAAGELAKLNQSERLG